MSDVPSVNAAPATVPADDNLTRERTALAHLDDHELAAASSERAARLCASDTPLGHLFPVLGARQYLQMPSRLLPPGMYKPFGRRAWRDLMGMSPRDVAAVPRLSPRVVGELLVKLRAEAAALEASNG